MKSAPLNPIAAPDRAPLEPSKRPLWPKPSASAHESPLAWPPPGTGTLTIQFGKVQSGVSKTGWNFEVTWHRKPCVFDPDSWGDGCPGAAVYLWGDEDMSGKRSLNLLENFPDKGKGHPFTFWKAEAGWLGATILPSNQRAGEKGLLLVHFSHLGQLTAGIWLPKSSTFYQVDSRAFAANPNKPLRILKEVPLKPNAPLPPPFQHRAHAFEGPEGFVPFTHGIWHHFKCEPSVKQGEPGWKINDFAEVGGDQERFLPHRGASEIQFPRKGLFSGWRRDGDAWVSTHEASPLPETFGVIEKSRLTLSLYDSGLQLLTLDEERSNGERWVYRLDPGWLRHPGEKPSIVAYKKLENGDSFNLLELKPEPEKKREAKFLFGNELYDFTPDFGQGPF